MSAPYVLVVDDSKATLAALELLFAMNDIPCVLTATPEEALARLAEDRRCVVLQDMNFSGEMTSGRQGAELFRKLRALYPDVPVILMTAWTSLEMAVALIKEGAEDYIAKPWDDAALVDRVRSALSRVAPMSRGAAGIVAESEAMRRTVEAAQRVAGSDAPVLVTGPNGAGKERIAELVHAGSPRARAVFLRVDVGALPDNLLEAELFGADAGAYTGATRRREGLFEAADRGTLFLDEIGNLPLSGQAKLLRVLQSGEFRRLGSAKPQRADVRVIVATNVDLKRAVDSGAFREDLYFRLAVVEIRVPPLRERPEDVAPLAQHFLRLFGSPVHQLEDAALVALRAHTWPGNVRELENRIRSAVIMCDGRVVNAGHLRLADPPGTSSAHPDAEAAERRAVLDAIDASDGVVARAAERLGLSRQALYRKMQRLGIEVERRVRK